MEMGGMGMSERAVCLLLRTWEGPQSMPGRRRHGCVLAVLIPALACCVHWLSSKASLSSKTEKLLFYCC